MASINENTCEIEEKISELSVNSKIENEENKKNNQNGFKTHLSGFELRDLYKFALSFYKEQEGKAVHLSYEDKLKLVAHTQQVSHGKFSPEKSAELGVLDVIGRDRQLAWQNLGNMTKEEAMEGFIVSLDKLCPLFKTVVEAKKRDNEEKIRVKKEEELRKIEEAEKLKEMEEVKKKEEEKRLKQEYHRRQIQDALNQQTFHQFKNYAEQQYPGNPEQQGVLIRQLQEQHYHQYMHQLHKELLVTGSEDLDKNEKNEELIEEANTENKTEEQIDDEDNEKNDSESNEIVLEDEDEEEEKQDWPPIVPAEMWTRKGVEEFKETIKKEAGDAIIKVGHGETVTVRVPTHDDGTCLFWEFATDGYDIGFGVYFEWSKPDTNQVSVHISESEDEDDDDEYESKEDLESGVEGVRSPVLKSNTPPISVIVPVYRRDCQEEVYAGSHQYPEQGVYLLKFDNSYSLWRSKTLYYRVYYTRPGANKE